MMGLCMDLVRYAGLVPLSLSAADKETSGLSCENLKGKVFNKCSADLLLVVKQFIEMP